MVDFLAAIDNGFKDPAWSGPTMLPTGYAFAGAVLFRLLLRDVALSAAMERRLGRPDADGGS